MHSVVRVDNMTPILEVKNVSKSFASLRAVDGVSLSVEPKSVTILIGPNGSGKTTLINMMSGLYAPDSGSVIFEGKDITGKKPYEIYRLGLARTFQVPALFWKSGVLENVLVAKRGHADEMFVTSLIRKSWKEKEKEIVEEAFNILKFVDLLDVWDKPANTLSGGQMKLLEIGRALMSGARTVLLDEPISGVNPTLANQIFSKLLTLRDELGVTFFIIEHRLDVALHYVDSVAAMAFGRLIATGLADDVLNNPKVIDAYLGE